MYCKVTCFFPSIIYDADETVYTTRAFYLMSSVKKSLFTMIVRFKNTVLYMQFINMVLFAFPDNGYTKTINL